jgi:hypothetical protein
MASRYADRDTRGRGSGDDSIANSLPYPHFFLFVPINSNKVGNK